MTSTAAKWVRRVGAAAAGAAACAAGAALASQPGATFDSKAALLASRACSVCDADDVAVALVVDACRTREGRAAVAAAPDRLHLVCAVLKPARALNDVVLPLLHDDASTRRATVDGLPLAFLIELAQLNCGSFDGDDGDDDTHVALAAVGAALASAGVAPLRSLLSPSDSAAGTRTDHWWPSLHGLRLLEAVGPPGGAGDVVVSRELHRVLEAAALQATASVLAADAAAHERASARSQLQLLPVPELHAAADALGRRLASCASVDAATFAAVHSLADAVRARLRHPRTSRQSEEAAVQVLSAALVHWPASLLAHACAAVLRHDGTGAPAAPAAVYAAASLCDTLTALEPLALAHSDSQHAGDADALLRQQAATARQHAALLLPALHALAARTLTAADDGSEHSTRHLRHAIARAVSSVLCLGETTAAVDDGAGDTPLSRARQLRLHAFTVLSLCRAPSSPDDASEALRAAGESLARVTAGGDGAAAVGGVDTLVAAAVAHAADTWTPPEPATAFGGSTSGTTRHQPRVALLELEEADTLTSAEDDQRRTHPTAKGRAALLSRYARLLGAASAGEVDAGCALPSALDPVSGAFTTLSPSWVDVLLCWTRQRASVPPHPAYATRDEATSLLAALLGRRVEADTRRWAMQHFFRQPAFRDSTAASTVAVSTTATPAVDVSNEPAGASAAAVVSPRLRHARALIAQQWLLSSLYGTVAPPPVDAVTATAAVDVAPRTLSHVRGVVARELCRWMPRHTQWKRREPAGNDVPADALPPFVHGELVRRVQAAAHGPTATLPPLHVDAFTPPQTVSVPLQVHALKAAAFVAGVGPWRSAACAAELARDADGPVNAGSNGDGGGTSLADAAWLRGRLVVQGAHVAAGYLAEALTARLAALVEAAPQSPAGGSTSAGGDIDDRLLPLLSPALLACMPVAAEATSQYRDASAALRQSVRFLANLAYVPHAVVAAQAAADVGGSGDACAAALVACADRVRGAAALAAADPAATAANVDVHVAGASRLASLAGVWASAGNMKLRGHSLRLVTNLQLCDGASGGGSSRRPPAVPVQVGDHVVPIYDSDHGADDPAGGGDATEGAGGDDADAGVDVVLVHGLQGGAVKTWRCPGVDPFASGADGHDYRQEACAAAGSRGADAAIDWAASRQYIVRDGERAAFWPSLWLAPDLCVRLRRAQPQPVAAVQQPQKQQSPRVRLFAVTYDADVWLSDSVRPTAGVPAVARDVAAQLLAAGVGAGGRPVVFLCHSLGGILTKYMLLLPPGALPHAAHAGRDNDDGDAAVVAAAGAATAAGNELARRTAGVVFYGTPHRGAEVAAKALAGLQSMHRWLRTPNPHPLVTPHVLLLQDTRELTSLNARFGAALVRQAAEPLPVRTLPTDDGDDDEEGAAAGAGAPPPLPPSLPSGGGGGTSGGHVAVLSVAETLPCDVQQAMGFAPRRERRGGAVDASRLSVLVVPPSSANPHFGAFASAPGSDHISVCKPAGVWDLRYTLARDFTLEAAAAHARADTS